MIRQRVYTEWISKKTVAVTSHIIPVVSLRKSREILWICWIVYYGWTPIIVLTNKTVIYNISITAITFIHTNSHTNSNFQQTHTKEHKAEISTGIVSPSEETVVNEFSNGTQLTKIGSRKIKVSIWSKLIVS